MTADYNGVSTGPQIRSRVPVANTTSMTPGDIGNAVTAAASEPGRSIWRDLEG